MNIRNCVRQLQWERLPEQVVQDYLALAPQIKEAIDKSGSAGERLAQLINLKPGTYPGGIPNSPGPLRSMLVGGLAGAGVGYLGGALAERVLPDTWERRRLRRTLAAIGGLAGATPGAMWGLVNKSDGRDFNDSSLFQQSGYKPEPKIGDIPIDSGLIDTVHFADKVSEYHEYIKSANLFPNSGLGYSPIPVDEFNRVIWQEPRVSSLLSPPVQAAASGLVSGAAALGGRQARFVTPFDIGRIAAGMGTGYLSGALVGKGLGLLMGMPRQTQEKLKNTGMMAGIIANLVPIAFGA